jgi:hypothetical protein
LNHYERLINDIGLVDRDLGEKFSKTRLGSLFEGPKLELKNVTTKLRLFFAAVAMAFEMKVLTATTNLVWFAYMSNRLRALVYLDAWLMKNRFSFTEADNDRIPFFIPIINLGLAPSLETSSHKLFPCFQRRCTELITREVSKGLSSFYKNDS